MSRGKAWLRHHRRRVIAKRLKVQRRWDQNLGIGPSLRCAPRVPGRYAKWNLVCSCGLCTMGKREDKRKERHLSRLSLKTNDWNE